MLRDHTPVVIEQFNGLWNRGDADSVPLDHFSDCNNVQFIESGFKTRNGFNTFLAQRNPVRIYTFNTDVDGFLILDTSANIYHVVYGISSTLILHVDNMTDFKFVNVNNRAIITPISSNGFPTEFLYIYNGDGTPARKAAGLPPADADGVLVAVDSATAGNVEVGIHIFGTVYETDSGYLTAIGGLTLAVLTETLGTKSVDLSGIPVSPSSYVTKRHIVASKSIDPSLYTGNTKGYQLYFLPDGVISDNVATTLTVNFYDAELLDDASHLFDNFSEIASSNGLATYHNRLISYSEYNNTALVRVSFPGEPEAISQVDGLLQLPVNGLGILNAFVYRDILYICKINQTIAYTDNGDVPSSWPYVVIDDGNGCTNHGLCFVGTYNNEQNVTFVLLFNLNGIFMFNGVFQKPELSYKIKDLWLSYDELNIINNYEFYNDPLHQIIYINLPNLGYFLAGDYANGLNPKDIRWTKWGVDVEPTTMTLFNKDNKLVFGAKE